MSTQLRTDPQQSDDPVRDGLTGLVNRAGLEVLVDYAVARSRRDGEPFTLLSLDLEGLKLIGALFGESAGDRALVEFANLVRTELRASDVVARTGDEEFAVLLTGTDARGAGVVINHLGSMLRDRNHNGERRFELTAVVKRASFDESNDGDTAEGFLGGVLDGLRGGKGVMIG